ncbi:MAG: hypothetical protein JW793_13790 [Acidobacteria bacterium]|nr:hypothetical protein [Acidobacteriota bacterium]
MRQESRFIPYFSRFPGLFGALSLFLFCFAPSSAAQQQRINLPDPVKFVNKFDMVANAVRAVLKEQYDIELEDRKAGIITTRPYEFISGSLTGSEMNKVALNRNPHTGNWLKARYSVEATMEIVSPTETLVTVRTKIEALNQAVDGTEQWLPLESVGTLERRILGKISAILMGKKAEDTKEGFWGQRPQPVDPRRSRFPGPSDR